MKDYKFWIPINSIVNNFGVKVIELKCPNCGNRITVTGYMIEHNGIPNKCVICDKEGGS